MRGSIRGERPLIRLAVAYATPIDLLPQGKKGRKNAA
jgi:hypothetical protein